MTRRELLTWALAAPTTKRGAGRRVDSRKLEVAFARAASLDRLTSLAIHLDGKLVRQMFQNGLSDETTLTNVKSISKSILALLVGIALEKGHLGSVHDRVSKYLPKQFTKASGLHRLSIRQLLTMTGALAAARGPSWGEMSASANWVEHLVAKGPSGPPGKFRYSTGDTHILSVLLTHATGQSTLSFAQRHLFGPLGISQVRWDTDPQGFHVGGNDMYFGTRDLARIGTLVLDEGRFAGRRIVSARWVRTCTRKAVDISEEEGDPIGKLGLTGYGFLWWTMKLAGHDASVGWGYGRQYLIIVPALRAVVTLTSRYDDPPTNPHHRAVTALIDPTLAEALASAG